MKKLAIVAAVAATSLSNGAYAVRDVNARLANPGYEMYIGTFPLVTTCAAGSQEFSIDGANAGQVQMQGNICLDPNGTASPIVRLTFHLTGAYSAGSPNPGTTFDQGSIYIDVETADGYLPYSTVVVSSTSPVECLANRPGHDVASVPTQITTGLQVASGTAALPGVAYTGAGPNQDNAICVTTLLFQSAGLFAGGTITAP